MARPRSPLSSFGQPEMAYPAPQVASPSAACGLPPPLAARARLHVMRNARSGSARALHAGLDDVLAACGRPITHHRVRRGISLDALAQQAARDAQADGGLLLAVGGDGTLRTAAQAAWQVGVPMAALASGTFNYFARSHGLGETPEEALQRLSSALEHGQLAAVQLGLVGDQVFLVNASLGLYPELLIDREAVQQRWGRSRAVSLIAAVWSLARSTWRRRLRLHAPHAAQASSPDDSGELATLFVCNNPLQWNAIGLGNEAEAADDAPHSSTVGHGELGFAALAPLGRRDMAALVLRASLGQLRRAPGVQAWTLPALDVSCPAQRTTRLRVAFDGETTHMHLPLHFGVAPRPLWLLLPPPERSA